MTKRSRLRAGVVGMALGVAGCGSPTPGTPCDNGDTASCAGGVQTCVACFVDEIPRCPTAETVGVWSSCHAAKPSQASGSTSTSTGSGGPLLATPLRTALAIHLSELPNPSQLSGVQDSDPLFIIIDSGGLTCGDPFGRAQCHDHWTLVVELPAAYETLGTISLGDPNILSDFGGEEPYPGATSCVQKGSSGSYAAGVLEVESIDSQGLRVRITGTDPEPDLPNGVDGEYTIARCSAEPDGILFSENGKLALKVGNHGFACSAPSFEACPSPQWDVTVEMPAAYQLPGTYSLNDPAIQSYFAELLPEDSLGCQGGNAGELNQGSIQISSVDSTGLVARFVGIGYHAAELDRDLTIRRCP